MIFVGLIEEGQQGSRIYASVRIKVNIDANMINYSMWEQFNRSVRALALFFQQIYLSSIDRGIAFPSIDVQ